MSVVVYVKTPLKEYLANGLLSSVANVANVYIRVHAQTQTLFTETSDRSDKRYGWRGWLEGYQRVRRFLTRRRGIHSWRPPELWLIFGRMWRMFSCLVFAFGWDWTVWDVRNGRCTHTLTGHHGEISSTQFSYSSDLCISGSIDRTCKVFA